MNSINHFTSANTFSVLFQTLSPISINSDEIASSNSEEMDQNINGNMRGDNQECDERSEKELQRVDISSSHSKAKTKKKRVPRRVIHFSDGVLEEFSTDSEEEEAKKKAEEEGKMVPYMKLWYFC